MRRHKAEIDLTSSIIYFSDWLLEPSGDRSGYVSERVTTYLRQRVYWPFHPPIARRLTFTPLHSIAISRYRYEFSVLRWSFKLSGKLELAYWRCFARKEYLIDRNHLILLPGARLGMAQTYQTFFKGSPIRIKVYLLLHVSPRKFR